MAEVLFYHLTQATVESTLPGLIEKTLARNWRAVIRFGMPERLSAIDNLLWTCSETGFIPHGTADEHAAEHPVYLTTGSETPNAPDLLFLIDGAEAGIDEIERMTRTILLFDGRDEAAVGAARNGWRDVKEAGITAIYWAQEDGRWIEKQRTGTT